MRKKWTEPKEAGKSLWIGNYYRNIFPVEGSKLVPKLYYIDRTPESINKRKNSASLLIAAIVDNEDDPNTIPVICNDGQGKLLKLVITDNQIKHFQALPATSVLAKYIYRHKKKERFKNWVYDITHLSVLEFPTIAFILAVLILLTILILLTR